jgi:transcriptional regulator with XRE-family HTH domain
VTDTETLAEVKARFLKSKDNRKLWDQTERKRGVAMALAQYRHERGVSQKDIAERTGWDKGFVSRLEGAQGGVPETKTLARYVEACGARLGVVVIDEETAKSGRARVLEVISGAPRDRQLEGGSVTLDLPDGETVKLSDFGSFVVRPKTVRVGRNPKTGAKITPPRREMVFEPSNALKAKINQALKSQS